MKKYLSLLEKTLILFLLLLVFVSGIDRIKFHADESQWISTSSVFEEFFSGRFNSSQFNESFWTVTQPPIARYVIGFGRRLGGYRPPDLNTPWVYSDDAPENIRHNARPSDGLLWWSRAINAVLAALSIFAVGLFLQASFGRLSLYLWVILCIMNSYFIQIFCHAMSESTLIATTILALASYYLLVRLAGTKYQLFCVLVAGACVGLAAGTKLNGFALLGAGICIIGVLSINLKDGFLPRLLFFVINSICMFFSVMLSFAGFNPYLWKDPLGRTLHMLQNRYEDMFFQVGRFYGGQGLIDIHTRMQIIPERVFSSLSSLRDPHFYLVNVLLFMVGLALAMLRSRSWFNDGGKDPFPMILILCAAFVSAPVLGTLLDWDRYFLYPVFFSLVFIAIGLAWLLQSLFFYVRRLYAPNYEN